MTNKYDSMTNEQLDREVALLALDAMSVFMSNYPLHVQDRFDAFYSAVWEAMNKKEVKHE